VQIWKNQYENAQVFLKSENESINEAVSNESSLSSKSKPKNTFSKMLKIIKLRKNKNTNEKKLTI